MCISQPEFLKVLPADIGRVGFDGAAMLALIRYKTADPDEHYGRHRLDGAMWWQASQKDIGEALGGLSHDAVRRTISKLEKLGEVVCCTLWIVGVRTKGYRVPDQPGRETAPPVTSHDAETRDPTRNRVPVDAKSRVITREIASPIPITELTEETTEERARPRPSDIPDFGAHSGNSELAMTERGSSLSAPVPRNATRLVEEYVPNERAKGPERVKLRILAAATLAQEGPEFTAECLDDWVHQEKGIGFWKCVVEDVRGRRYNATHPRINGVVIGTATRRAMTAQSMKNPGDPIRNPYDRLAEIRNPRKEITR